MVPFNFDYFKPVSIQEAVELFQKMDRQGKQPMYFSGGTELITLGRINLAYSEAVIDIKDIREFHIIEESENDIILGSALSLTKAEEANPFPLLTKTASEVADHTARGKITLGGNICAQIFYREACLPFLLADSKAVIAGPDGIKTIPINDIFHEQLQLNRGEILVQLITEKRAVNAPFINIKRRQQWETGYPLVTVAALKLNSMLRIAVSGLCPFPFRSKELEMLVNNKQVSTEERVNRALAALPAAILDDVEGSAEYRLFVFKNVLYDVLAALD